MVTSYTFVKMLITSLFSSTESHLFSFLTKILLPFCASSQAPSLETACESLRLLIKSDNL